MPERLGGGEPAVGGTEHAIEQRVARLVRRHFLAQQAGDIDVDVSGLLRKEMSPDQAGDALLDCMFRTANGRLTAAEALGHREFVLTRLYESA